MSLGGIRNGGGEVSYKEICDKLSQCGYCQSGQLIAATSLLDQINNPSDEEIDTAMSNNICRCGTYTRIKKAIHKAAALKNTSV